VWVILNTVGKIFEDFPFHRELIDGNDWVLEFSALVGDSLLKRIDLLRINDDRQIVGYEVFIRPANGLQALDERMSNRLARLEGKQTS
jgi:hypothetical protein